VRASRSPERKPRRRKLYEHGRRNRLSPDQLPKEIARLRGSAEKPWGTGGVKTFNRASPWDAGILNAPPPGGGGDAFNLREQSSISGALRHQSQKVEGDASLRIDLNGFPRGTKTAHEADGMFKTVKLNRGPSISLAGDTA
jgi:hypothetical protein